MVDSKPSILPPTFKIDAAMRKGKIEEARQLGEIERLNRQKKVAEASASEPNTTPSAVEQMGGPIVTNKVKPRFRRKITR